MMTSSALLVKTGLSYDVPEPSNGPSSETNYAPRPLSSYETYLNNCGKKLNSNCGHEVFFAVFFGNETVSNNCCLNLVNDLGKRCHDDLTKYILQLPEFKTNEIKILQRSEKVWNNCVLVDFPSPKPVGAEA